MTLLEIRPKSACRWDMAALGEVMLRLEHAPAVPTSVGLRTNLDGDTDQYGAAMDFQTVSSELQRGQKTKFTLSVPMRLRGVSKSYLPPAGWSVAASAALLLAISAASGASARTPARLRNDLRFCPVSICSVTKNLPSRCG